MTRYIVALIMLACGASVFAAKPRAKQPDAAQAAENARIEAIAALDRYDVDEAEDKIDTWESQLRRAKKPVPEAVGQMRSRLVMIKNMLERVERIAIIDSIDVDSASFFKAYKLSAEAGRLLDGSSLPPQYSRRGPRVVYRPESGTELLWAMSADTDGPIELYSAGILDDGSMEEPRRLGDDLGDGGNADFPFLMPDGVTLYFANDGDNSLGGYDIFLSRREADGSVLQPQNIGMPYNSPYNDYMLAIDEQTGLGWWATDRNQVPGKVTIYTFVPNESRVNYDADADDITDRALAKSIAATREPGKDYASMLRNLDNITSQGADAQGKAEFALSMGNGKVYTQLSQFKSQQAREAMELLLEREQEHNRMKAQVSALRRAYAKGDTSVETEILSLEKRIQAAYPMLKKLRSNVVKLER